MSLLSARHRGCTCLRLLQRRYVASNATNQPIVDMLKKNAEEEEQKEDKNQFKARALGLAVRIIEQVPFPIRSSREVINIEGIGPGITRRISEFLQEKTTADREELDKRALDAQARKELRQVQGIGQVRSRALVEAGCMSIADLHRPDYFNTLRPVEQFGVKYYEDMKCGVKRDEAEAILRVIQDILPPQYECILVGSYRRGAIVSSEVDVLLLHPLHTHVPVPTIEALLRKATYTINGRRRVPFNENDSPSDNSSLQKEVIPALEGAGLLGENFMNVSRKWQGMVKVPGTGALRRLDLSFAPMKSKGAALIALTGDKEFNLHLRTKAERMGLHLNEYGLWKWLQTESSSDITEADSAASTSISPPSSEMPFVPAVLPNPNAPLKRVRSPGRQFKDFDSGFWRLLRADTEEAIMRELGMEYVEPLKRNFSYVEKPPGWAKGRGRKKGQAL
ncbi:hypothetical protein EV714DRAFT_251205 [Schizophyllum commune]